MKTLLQTIEQLPPFVVFALGRRRIHGRKRHVDDIVAESGLSKRTFSRIAARLTWRGVKIEDIDGFCRSCRVNPLAPYQAIRYIRLQGASKKAYPHLTKTERLQFNKKCELWLVANKTGT